MKYSETVSVNSLFKSVSDSKFFHKEKKSCNNEVAYEKTDSYTTFTGGSVVFPVPNDNYSKI